jgi:hypothetical protein
MATVNGLGTMRYDWQRRSEGTADATLWFVIFFLPIAPLRREQVRVVGSGIQPTDFLSLLAAFGGAGKGFQTTIEVLGPAESPGWRILKTYVLGWIGVPLLTLVGPALLIIGAVTLLGRLGIQIPTWISDAAPALGLAGIVWVACVVAWILDYAAGRRHVDSGDQRRRGTKSPTRSRRTPPSAT